jgi:ketopantoate reductase
MDFDAGMALEIDSLNGYLCNVARDQGGALLVAG